MPTTELLSTIRISGRKGMLAAIPAVLGFHPRRSVVVVCLVGPRRRLGPVIRVDLPSSRDTEQAAMLAGHASAYADEVIVVAYQDTTSRRSFLDQLLKALRGAEVPVADVFAVSGDRAWPARTRSEQRARRGFAVPDANDPEVQELAAMTALSGRAVLDSREALADSIAGPTGNLLSAAEHAIDEAAGAAPATGPDPALARAIEALDGAERCLHATETTGTVPLRLAASLAVAVQDPDARQAVIARAVVDVDEEWPAALVACVSQVPDAQAAVLCSVLAVVAYRHGDGALAQVALDRCLAAEPGNELAGLMRMCISVGMHPARLARLADLDGGPPIASPIDCDPECGGWAWR